MLEGKACMWVLEQKKSWYMLKVVALFYPNSIVWWLAF